MRRLEILLIFYCKKILSDSSHCFILNGVLIFHVVLYTDKEAPEEIIESSDSKLLAMVKVVFCLFVVYLPWLSC